MKLSKKYNIPNYVAKAKVYSKGEFLNLKGAENRRERLIAAIIDCREDMLNDTDRAYLELLKQAFKIMSKSLSPIVRRRKLQSILQLNSRGRILQVMRDVEAVFCDVDEQSKLLDKVLFEHKLSRLIEKIEKKDVEAASLPRLYALLAKVQGHDLHEENKIPYDQLQLPIPVYTSDPNAIAAAEDITHEEVDNE